MTESFQIAVLPGDGVGVEVTEEAVRVLRAAEAKFGPGRFRFELETHAAGARCFLDRGTDMPDETWDACYRADAIFLGAMGLPSVRRDDGTEIAPQLDLRRKLDLYAGVRPVRLFHEAHTPLRHYSAGDIDFVIVRESTEGLFVSRDAGVLVGDDIAVDNLVITRKGSARVIEYAYRLVQRAGATVTCVDKANVFRSYALFRRVFDEVAKSNPGVVSEHAYIDAMALHLVRNPRHFDVIVTENMYGDILSDLAAGLVGGMGLAPSADIGDDRAVFQPAHGSAPDIAGRGVANPIAAILSVAMLLEHLGGKRDLAALDDAARAVRRAVEEVFSGTPRTTPDLGGEMKCAEVGSAVAERIGA